ncbi:MAG: sialate O-acetylesterase [Lachnospiraceae bacterium]
MKKTDQKCKMQKPLRQRMIGLLAAALLLGGLYGCGRAQETQEENQSENSIVTVEPETVAEEAVSENTVSGDVVSYSAIPVEQVAPSVSINVVAEESVSSNEVVVKTEDGKVVVDLVIFMGQSNMSGCGGDAAYAPKVPAGHGYEFRAISDPTRLYPITEPFGSNENNINGIMDLPGAKRGSLISSFANTYYAETGVPIVAVSASAGGTDTAYWLSSSVTSDFKERQARAQVWLESNDYYIRRQYVIWLQGESDAADGITSEKYNENMDNIIRPLFIGGVQKVFMITPGRTITRNQYFNDIIKAQLEMCKTSGYYALATTVLNGISTEYMVDEWHYNQSALNLVGSEAAKSAAYYTNNQKEMCLYDYKNQTTFIPGGFDYPEDTVVEPVDLNNSGILEKLQ